MYKNNNLAKGMSLMGHGRFIILFSVNYLSLVEIQVKQLLLLVESTGPDGRIY